MRHYDQSAQNSRQKLFIRGLNVCAGRLDIENLLKSLLIYSVSYFNLEALGLCLEGRSPPTHPVATGLSPPELPISDENDAQIANTGV